MFQYNSVIPTWSVVRFACRSSVASEASDVSVYSARVAFGVFIPRQDRRAAPPVGCFALMCFLLVTFLDSGHPALRRCAASSAVRAAPAAQCTSKEKLPAGRKTAEALRSLDEIRRAL